jgi:hypothetical protein
MATELEVARKSLCEKSTKRLEIYARKIERSLSAGSAKQHSWNRKEVRSFLHFIFVDEWAGDLAEEDTEETDSSESVRKENSKSKRVRQYQEMKANEKPLWAIHNSHLPKNMPRQKRDYFYSIRNPRPLVDPTVAYKSRRFPSSDLLIAFQRALRRMMNAAMIDIQVRLVCFVALCSVCLFVLFLLGTVFSFRCLVVLFGCVFGGLLLVCFVLFIWCMHCFF